MTGSSFPETRRLGSRMVDPVERLSPDELGALQLERLRAQVEQLVATNPFHRRRFAAHGVGADSIRSVDDLRRFPFMSKADVLADTAEAPPFGTRLAVARHEIREILTSGGTAGRQPEVFAFTGDDLRTCVEIYAMHQHWNGADAGDIAMMMSPLGMLTSPPMNVRAWEHLGLTVLRTGPMSTEDRVEAFGRFRPEVLKLPFAYARRFMAACRDAGLDPCRDVPNLKFVGMSGGAYPLEFADEISEFFGAPLHEVFGCSQAGTVISGTCEAGVRTPGGRGWMHCFDHQFVVEVIDPVTGEEVGEGDEGELVITPLFRRASPVFRYRMNDRVRKGSAKRCSCGRPFSTLECGTTARYDDMLKIKGVNLWVHELDRFILEQPHVDEFNGLVTIDERGRETARVLVELHEVADDCGVREELCRGLERQLRQAFRIAFEVVEVPQGTVRRFELKQRRWTDQRSAHLARAGEG